MTKKNFKENNPATAFITASSPETQEEIQEETIEIKRKPKPPKGYKINPEIFIETKSKRVQLVLQPSVVNAVKKIAKKKKQSMNETINEAIIEYLEKEGKNI